MSFLFALLIATAHATTPKTAVAAPMTTATVSGPVQKVDVKVDESGFTPAQIHATPGSSVELRLTRTTKDACATAIQIPSLKIKRELPLNQVVSIKLDHLKKGEIKFGCTDQMMFTGVVVVE